MPRHNAAGNGIAPLLDIRGVFKGFGGLQVLDGFDLAIAAGDLLSIIGPNGCGKTTLFNVVTGTFPPDAGEIFFSGRNIAGLSAHQIARLGLSRKFQVPGVFPELTVSENLELPLASTGGYAPLRLIGLKPDDERAAMLLDLCGLASKAGDRVGTLAHGERQWLEIAMLLAADPRVILLDEPTAGMTLVETERTAALIRRLRDEFDKTVLVIEHDMRFVQRLNCPVAVMLRGRIARAGSYDEIRQDPEVIKAYLGQPDPC